MSKMHVCSIYKHKYIKLITTKRFFAFWTLYLFQTAIWAGTPKVLIIGIDGCRQSALLAANTPNIDSLLAHAVYSFDALCEYPTWSGTGWSGMLTGVWHYKHGVTDNSFSSPHYDLYPHFIQHIQDLAPEKQTISIAHWSPINNEICSGATQEINVSTDLEVKNQAVNALINNNPDVLFVAFDDVDHAGHSYGFDASVPQYIATIETTDNYVGNILTALHDRPNYANEDWLIIVTPDHGGNLFGHGQATYEERNIFAIYSNPKFTAIELQKTPHLLPLNNQFVQYNGSNSYASVANNTVFNFGATQDFTIECRVKCGSYVGDPAIVSNKNWDSGSNKGFVIAANTGGKWKVNIGDGINRADFGGGWINDNQWHHLTVTFDRSGELTAYENGERVGYANISSVGNINNTLALAFGQDGTLDYNYFFGGKIAEVRMFNALLSPQTIATWSYQNLNNTHPDYANLVGYWQGTDGLGNTLADNNPNALHPATLSGGVAWQANTTDLVCYDFSQTPRIVDVAVTALDHLCIPIDPAWQLDGISQLCHIQPLIEGSSQVCSPQLSTYQVANIRSCVSYIWTVSGGTIVAGQGTPQINVQWDNGVQGIVSVNTLVE